MNIMMTQPFYIFLLILALTALGACDNSQETHESSDKEIHQEASTTAIVEEPGALHLSNLKFNSLDMEVGVIPKRALADIVRVNGQLEVPPQYEASVTAILGANITGIDVIEGEEVQKNQVLANLAHPNLSKVQTDYVRAYKQMQYLEKEYDRQKRLYNEEVGSGQTFQRIEADYKSTIAEVKGFEAQLRQLNLDVEKVRSGEIYETVPVVSPIDGFIENVGVQLGQYVDPQTELFEIINNDHIHADFMVFEKDVHKIKDGQTVSFSVQARPNELLTGKIYSVGKKFEQNPKAVHVHAEIDQKRDHLIPGTYINGKIMTSNKQSLVLPESAIVEEEGKSLIFTVSQHTEDGQIEWEFTPIEIKTGLKEGGFVEVKLLTPLPPEQPVALNNAYYLISEMKKSETSHGH
ncbi:MAG: efflux RND transporter periplasmic adaptor subunit [Cytophagales bacterium]